MQESETSNFVFFLEKPLEDLSLPKAFRFVNSRLKIITLSATPVFFHQLRAFRGAMNCKNISRGESLFPTDVTPTVN
jgi:hypothetical protein